MANIEILNDQPYFEANTVRIGVHSGTHRGKYWQHTHPFYEFVYVLDGFMLHSYNGETSVLTSGDLFAIYPGNVHSYTAAYPTTIFNILFYLDELECVADGIKSLPGILWDSDGIQMSALPIVNVEPSERGRLVELLRSMVRERKERKVGWELNLRSMLISFLVMYSRFISKKAPGDAMRGDDRQGYSTYVYSALRYIEDNYANDMSAKDIADAVGISCDYLTRKFKSAMSATPMEYVRKFRIAKSMNLLRDSDMSVSEIAVRTGFGEASIFSRTFKQVIGVTPAAFRKE